MEKLIELLNEWERERVNHNTKEYMKRGKNSFTRLGIIEVISKSYGFIEWLVDNNKINTGKIDKDRLETIQYSEKERITIYDWLLMLLAIQDEPIEFLISILK